MRIVPGIGALGEGTMARRGGEALAALLGVEPVVFPGGHGGFAVSEWSPGNDPAAFADDAARGVGRQRVGRSNLQSSFAARSTPAPARFRDLRDHASLP